MSYQIMYRLTCDWQEPNTGLRCIARFEGTADEAMEIGWALGDEWELCPPHGIAHTPADALEAPAPPLPVGVLRLEPHPDFIFAAPDVAAAEDLPEPGEQVSEEDLNAVIDLPGTQRLIGVLTAEEDDEGDTRGEGWLASNLRRWSRMAGRHAAPDRRPARDRAPVHSSR